MIHNFKDVKEEESHRSAWTKQVLDTYRTVEENDEMETEVMIAGKGGLSEKSIIHTYKAGCILHVSLVNNTSEYGLRYNTFSIQHIKGILRNQIIKGKKQIIYTKLLDCIRVHLHDVELSILGDVLGERIKCKSRLIVKNYQITSLSRLILSQRLILLWRGRTMLLF